jgi:hypothetical protein
VLPALGQDEGGTDWVLMATLIAVGAVVLTAAGGLLVWSRVRRAREGSQS